MRRRRGIRAQLAVVAAVAASLGAGGQASGFGTTSDVLGQDPVHWKITRAALECYAQPRTDVADDAGRCFEPETMSLLSGLGASGLKIAATEFGAVEAADIDAFFESAPHCTDGDFLLPSTGYDRRQTFAKRTKNLRACRRYLRQRFESAIDTANGLVDADGRIIPKAVSTTGTSKSSRCQFVDRQLGSDRVDAFNRSRHGIGKRANPKANLAAVAILHLLGSGGNPRGESAKCQALMHLGATLHGVQDAYAHGNWTDRRDDGPVSIENPPGLARTSANPFMRLVGGTNTPDPRWITACYSLLGECARRVDHADFAKDNGAVALKSLAVGRSRLGVGRADEPRGRVKDNFRRAVEGARRASRDVWKDLGRELLRRYPDPAGAPRGRQIICALTHDDPVTDCFVLENFIRAAGVHLPPDSVLRPGVRTFLNVCGRAGPGADITAVLSPTAGVVAPTYTTIAGPLGGGQNLVNFYLRWDLPPGGYTVDVTARLGKHVVRARRSVAVSAPVGPVPQIGQDWIEPGSLGTPFCNPRG